MGWGGYCGVAGLERERESGVNKASTGGEGSRVCVTLCDNSTLLKIISGS